MSEPVGKFIDLTFSVEEGMLYYPAHWHTDIKVEKLGEIGREGRETRKIQIGTHSGTHMDAPLHFIEGGRSIDAVPLDICVGPALLMDLSGQSEVTAADIERGLNGREGIERLLVRFDWSGKWGDPSYYSGYPYFTREACGLLIDRGIKLLGMDTPSPDDPRNGYGSQSDSPNHKELLQSNVVLIEYLCNLHMLSGPEVFLVALPLKLAGADGSPARVIARDIR